MSNAIDAADEARGFMAGDRFAALLGIEVVSLTPERCVCAMPLTDDLRNAHRVAHGGAIFTLADYTAACVANSQGGRSMGINGFVVYMAAAADGPLRAEATCVRAGKTLIQTEVRITDGRDRLVATLTTTGFRVDPRA